MVNTTAQNFLKGASDLTLRENEVFKRLQANGNVSYNWSGLECRSQIKFALPETLDYTGEPLDFAPSDKYRTLLLDWRGKKTTDSMSELDYLKNRGIPQLVDRYGNIMKDMRESLDNAFAIGWRDDGVTYATKLHGIESFMTAGGTCDSGDKICMADVTFAGQPVKLAGIAGTWSSALADAARPNGVVATDWPSGSGTPEYDCLQPKMLNSTCTLWRTGTTAWVDVCTRVIRQAMIWCRLTNGREGRPDLTVLSEDYYTGLANSQEAKLEIMVPHQATNDIGFSGYQFQCEGAPVITEFGMPGTTGYCLNTKKFELRAMYSQLYMPRGPEFSMEKNAYLFAMGFFGNYSWEPKFQAKIYPYA
jgi:hypothetical protein